jgi:hypothetical protein
LDRSLEDGRSALIRFVRERRPQGSDRNTVTIIFDGQPGLGGIDMALAMATDVRVVFTQGPSADDHMRAMVEEAVRPSEIICVTNDRDLAIACRHRGAAIWSVEDFMAQGHKKDPFKGRRTTGQDHEGKVISHKAANRIDQEMADHWLRKKE